MQTHVNSMYMYVYMCMCMYTYTFWCMYMYAYMCTYMCMHMCMYMYAYAYVYVYVYDISTALWLMFLTCIFSDFIWWVDFRYCMFLVLPFIPWCSFTPPLMLLLYLLFACLLYFTCLYIVRNDENKDVQPMNQSINIWLLEQLDIPSVVNIHHELYRNVNINNVGVVSLKISLWNPWYDFKTWPYSTVRIMQYCLLVFGPLVHPVQK